MNSAIHITVLCLMLTGLVLGLAFAGCATGSIYMLQVDETTSLKVTEISHPNPISPSNQYTVLWSCDVENVCKPVSVNHVSTHGWLLGLVKDSIQASGHIFGGWLGKTTIGDVNVNAIGADGGSGGTGGDGGTGGAGGDGGAGGRGGR